MEDLKKELISRAGSSTALLISQILNTKKYENEITHLKKEVIELKESNENNDNSIINPSDYKFENEIIMKKEVKEEVIEKVTIKEEANE